MPKYKFAFYRINTIQDFRVKEILPLRTAITRKSRSLVLVSIELIA